MLFDVPALKGVMIVLHRPFNFFLMLIIFIFILVISLVIFLFISLTLVLLFGMQSCRILLWKRIIFRNFQYRNTQLG